MKSSKYGIGFKNYPVNLQKDTLRILHISNSYGGNLLHYVDALVRSAGVDVSNVFIERMVYSSGSFKSWYDVYRDKNPAKFSYYRMAGELEINLNGEEGDKCDGSKFRIMLEDNPWDLIVLNQASNFAPYYDNWDLTGDGGYLPELLSVIRSYQPEACIGILLIHSYAEDYQGNIEHWTTTERWEKIRDGVEWLKNAYDIDFVIPYGTAIQNLRLTQYNNSYDFTGDGTHLSGGLAQYTAGCCYFETVFKQRYNETIWGNSLRIPEPEVQYSDKFEGCVIPVDDTTAEIAQKAAFLASHNMYELRNPELADLTEYEYGEELNQDEYRSIYDFNNLNMALPRHQLSFDMQIPLLSAPIMNNVFVFSGSF